MVDLAINGNHQDVQIKGGGGRVLPPVTFEKDGLSGVVVPMGDSSIILVGEPNEDFTAIVDNIDKIVYHWLCCTMKHTH